METPVIDFWFEVYMTHTDESTETVFSSEKLNKALEYAKGKELKIDLWIIDQTVKDLPVPVLAITEQTTFEEIKQTLLDSENVTTDGMEEIIKKLLQQFL